MIGAVNQPSHHLTGSQIKHGIISQSLRRAFQRPSKVLPMQSHWVQRNGKDGTNQISLYLQSQHHYQVSGRPNVTEIN